MSGQERIHKARQTDAEKRAEAKRIAEEDTEKQAAEAAEKKRSLDDIDDLLDEIDGLLEENAEEFIKGYVQKGGE